MVPVVRARVSDADRLVLTASAQGLLSRHLATLRGQEVDLLVKKHQAKRSGRANNFYFGVVVPLLAAHCGYSKDEMHDVLAFKFLRIADDVVTGSPRRQRSSLLTTEQFSAYVEQCCALAAELGIVVPAPSQVTA